MNTNDARTIRNIIDDLRDEARVHKWSAAFGDAKFSSEQLAEAEMELNVEIPADLKELYSVVDGMEIEIDTRYMDCTSYVSVLSLNHLILYTRSLDEYTDQSRRTERARVSRTWFVAFGNLLDGDLCCLDLDRPANGRPYTIIATDHEQPNTWPLEDPIAASIADWLEEILKCARQREFLTYWQRLDTRDWPPDAERPPNAIR